jgi:hypothetical protein
MRNKSYLNLFLVLGLALFSIGPWACSKSFSVPNSPVPSSLSSTPTNTPTNTVTSTATLTSFTATSTATMTATSTAVITGTSFILSSGVTTLAAGTYTFGNVNISGSAMVTLGGPVTIFAQSFTLGAGATIRGLGYWDTNNFEWNTPLDANYCKANGVQIPSWSGATYIDPGEGPGNGGVNEAGGGGPTQDYTCGGGGHWGAGGSGFNPACEVAAGGVTYDNPVRPIYMGSGGGNPYYPYTGFTQWQAPESWGGGLIWIIVYNPNSNTVQPTIINGTIDMDGFVGCNACGPSGESGAGGSGGAILVEASTITGSGLLTANGIGNGGNGGAFYIGDAGGGIISLIENLTSFSGTTSALEGTIPGVATGCSVSNNGTNGSVTFTAAPASGY